MKVYITATFKEADNKAAIEEMCALVQQSGFVDFCFIRDVENYQKIFSNPHELMQRARTELADCDALLIEYDGPSHGRMVELGMAYALGKKVILITKTGTFVKDSIKGVVDATIEFDMLEEIVAPLQTLYTQWTA